jgi:hypothetical protein
MMRNTNRLPLPIRVINMRKLGRKNLEKFLIEGTHMYIGRDLKRYLPHINIDSDDIWGNPYALIFRELKVFEGTRYTISSAMMASQGLRLFSD